MSLDRASRIVQALSARDAWLCSIPHGQYEHHEPYSAVQAADLVREVLAEDARAHLAWND
jgi:hypothetical protein